MITLGDKIIAYLTLLSGLTISAVAVWYSVAGLVAIFAASVIPIMIMGVVLEVSKLIATLWLKMNWQRAPFLIKTYLLISIIILMIITSMGIFGFLSKAHSDQAVPAGDITAKIQIYDEKIAIQKEYIAQARKDIEVLNTQIDRYSELGAVSKGVRVRDQQKVERDKLLTQIDDAQTTITKLREERAPVAASMRAIEAEVGPIKYIAAFVYGDNPDANILEKAVTWVIIIIVSVFDPLAVILLLASQYSFQWFRTVREEQERNNELVQTQTSQERIREENNNPPESDDRETLAGDKKQSETVAADPPGWMFERIESQIEEPKYEQDDGPLTDTQIKQIVETANIDTEEDDILEEVSEDEKQAMTRWKAESDENTVKYQRRLLERGEITVLPWHKYLNANSVNEAAVEAAKWAAEQLEVKPETYMENVDGRQVIKPVEYQQNAEQTDSTLWKRVKDAKKGS